MAFHQLEKVLARAATNRSFRDELATGDADLDELGLSDDEQSVLSELVASSGAGLDAVLNVVASLPAGASTAGGPTAALAAAQGAQPRNGALPDQPGVSAPPAAPPPTTTPAFALMTPTVAHVGAVNPGVAAATPAGPAPLHTAMPTGYPVPAQGIPAGYPVPVAGMVPGYPVPAAATPAGYPNQGVAAPTGYGPVPFQSTQDGAAQGQAHQPTSPAAAGATRSLDAGDVGRPVVARLPFGMDVVK